MRNLFLLLAVACLAAPAAAQNGATDAGKLLNAAELAKGLDEGPVALYSILFAGGTATLKPESSPQLAAIGDLLKTASTLKLEIQGHTDNAGGRPANQTLSRARAAAVRDYLIKTFAIEPARLTAVGYADTKPIASNRTEQGRAKNRRIGLVKKD